MVLRLYKIPYLAISDGQFKNKGNSFTANKLQALTLCNQDFKR